MGEFCRLPPAPKPGSNLVNHFTGGTWQMTLDDLEGLCARRTEAINRHDVAGVIADYAINCVTESPSTGRLVGRAAVERTFRHWFAAFPDLRVHTDSAAATSDGGAVLTLSMWGTDTGGWLGQQPTGKPFRVSYINLLHFDADGHIVDDKRIYDLHGLMAQLATGHEMPAEASRSYQETLERARIEQEVRLAAEIQRALLPERRHTGMGFEVAATSIPCRGIGGDFFDYFDLPDGAFGFALGDVSGKGPPAALLAAELQGMLAAHAWTNRPAETVTHVNEVLARRPIDGRFVTLVYGVLRKDGRLTYTNAGHNFPVLITRGGVRRLDTGGSILGTFKQATFEEEAVHLNPGDVVVIFSDGVTEALNSEGAEFGEERLLSCIRNNQTDSAEACLERVFGSVRTFCCGAPQSDDITALVLRFTGFSYDRGRPGTFDAHLK